MAFAGLWLSPWVAAADPVDEVQKSAAEWARLRVETVKLESDWEWQRGLMEATRDAQLAHLKELEERRDELAAKTAGARRTSEELTAQRQSMREAAAAAANRLQSLDDRLVRMRAWLPPRLSAALDLPYRSLALPQLSMGERMQHTMTILNRCALFNSTVSHGEEAVDVAPGETKLLEVIYWGLSHGYALDRAARVAYVGSPTDDGWRWAAVPELTDRVEQLMAVHQDKCEPVGTELPVKISDPAALSPQS
jgi:FtsZ-binding cell division protein ZapB